MKIKQLTINVTCFHSLIIRFFTIKKQQLVKTKRIELLHEVSGIMYFSRLECKNQSSWVHFIISKKPQYTLLSKLLENLPYLKCIIKSGKNNGQRHCLICGTGIRLNHSNDTRLYRDSRNFFLLQEQFRGFKNQ